MMFYAELQKYSHSQRIKVYGKEDNGHYDEMPHVLSCDC